MKNFKAIADMAIAEAKKDLAAGVHVIDMGSDVKAEGITGYMARRIDGEEIEGRISAGVTLRSAASEIYKAGMKKRTTPILEAVEAYERIVAAIDELKLNDEEE